MNDKPEGYYWTLHRSMVDPMLMAGIDRNLCFMLWCLGAAISFVYKLYFFLVITWMIHMVVRHLTKTDSMFWKIFQTHIQTKRLFW